MNREVQCSSGRDERSPQAELQSVTLLWPQWRGVVDGVGVSTVCTHDCWMALESFARAAVVVVVVVLV
ncbi:unnamed protein product [Soboliphyme baturini]|uniref:Transmembrane protein n=1 Tax=Soboliphyme baturini TaxID=241478 RepID=A0A183J332_9BILA|nr:unnamed protein product [Soboliphyme baturini]